MKMLFCANCNDIFNLNTYMKNCICGMTMGRYIDKVNAEYYGEYAYPLGFTNESLKKALITQPNQGLGSRFEAFVIPKNCLTMKKK